MNEYFRRLGWLWMRWLGVFISPNHFLDVAGDGRTGQSGGAPNNHCSLSGARHISPSLGFGAVDRWSALSSCCTGQSGATPDSMVTSNFCRGTVHYCSLSQSTVWWIIEERASEFMRVACSKGAWLGAPDSVRCTSNTVWCAKNQHTQILLQFFDWIPNWISFLVCVEPYASEINDM
jgi:hypothetical protein